MRESKFIDFNVVDLFVTLCEIQKKCESVRDTAYMYYNTVL